MLCNGQKRTFLDIRERIVIALLNGPKTINQLATETNINWKTVSNHLIYLVGKGFATEILNTPYVRIFELSPSGRKHFISSAYNTLHLSKFNREQDKKEQMEIQI